ncbi:MAG: acyltransferase domain-containing protein, partial [Sphaerospermopsis kisseleviana]
HPNQELADICYTANTGREHFKDHRLAVVVEDKQQLIAQLAAFTKAQETATLVSSQVPKKLPKIAFLFTGQGSEYINMGRQLYDTEPVFRQTIDQCQEILRPYLQHSLLEILYPEPAAEQIASSLLKQTAYTQPALFAFEYALYQLWKSWGIQPKAVMGHNVGEYVAATVAGIFSLEHGLKLIVHQGRLMQQLASGGEAEFLAIANQITYNQPQIPLISNVTGKVADQDMTTAQYWVNHVSRTVQFANGMQTLHQLGSQVFLEIGPQPILLEMGRQCLPDSQGWWLPSLRPGENDSQAILSSLGQLYVAGFKVDWVGFDRADHRTKVALPTYPFQRQRYWIERTTAPNQKQYLPNLPTIENLHPLLGYKMRLAGTKEQRFQCEIGINQLAYLSDHRVFDQPVLPATAYLEMALAAGANLLKSDHLILEDVNLYQALILSEAEYTTVQIVVNNLENNTYQFEIFSFNKEQNLENQSCTLHAAGKISQDKETSEIGVINLPLLQKEYTEKVPTEILYRELEEQGIIYGSSFQAVKSLWKTEDKTLGFIQLSPELSPAAEQYKIHPALLDACLHSVYGLKLNIDQVGVIDIYLPIRIERLKLYRSSSSQLWSQVGISHKETSNPETLMIDVLLVDEHGNVVAEIEGVTGKRISRRAF